MSEDNHVKMVANSAMEERSKVTPYIGPLVAVLHSSELLTRCSACFVELDDENKQPESESKSDFVKYCSDPMCAKTDLPIHFESGEHDLFKILKNNPEYWPRPDSVDLRLAIRLRHLLFPSQFITDIDRDFCSDYPFPDRVVGLFHHNSRSDFESDRGSMLIALARATYLSHPYNFSGEDPMELVAFRVVVTNAVKVHMDGQYVGMALYDHRISWLNHSCDPNAKLIFKHHHNFPDDIITMKISASHPQIDKMEDVYTATELGSRCRGPRVLVKLHRDVEAGEEILISYIDPYSRWSQKFKECHFYRRYKFICGCEVCHSADASLDRDEDEEDEEDEDSNANQLDFHGRSDDIVGGSARTYSELKKSGSQNKKLMKNLVSGFSIFKKKKENSDFLR